jgi:hypothetical protein
MTNAKVVFLFIFLILPFAFGYDPKEGNVTATFGPYISRTDFRESSATGAKSPYSGGFGLVALGDINTYGALEIGMYHMHRVYIRDQGPFTISEKTELMHITMGYHYWINPYFSTSLTFSSGYSMGDPQIIYSNFPAGQEIDTSAQDTVEYGLDLSLQSELWEKERYSVIAEARYSYSLTPKENERGNHYGLMIALRYLIQEKYPDLTKDDK